MPDLWIADISDFGSGVGALPAGVQGRKLEFLGAIVSAASVAPSGESQQSTIPCRRRNRTKTGCKGTIRLWRDQATDEVRWECNACTDRGVVINWQKTRWDRSADVRSGRIVSLCAARARRAGKSAQPGDARVYELDVDLVYAPLVLEGRITRRIRLSGANTLQQLHRVIFQAFERVDEEAYEFMFGAPYEPDTRRYAGFCDEPLGDLGDGRASAASTTLDSLGLTAGDTFGYLFDFNDEWGHRITIRSVQDGDGTALMPAVIASHGAAPPQLDALTDGMDDADFWSSVDADYPLTSIHGPYNADRDIDRVAWRELDELERHLLVLEAHQHSLPTWHPEVTAPTLHAVIHVLAEDRLAELSRKERGEIMRRYRAGGVRHAAIHALGAELVATLLSLPADRPAAPNTRRRKDSSTDGPQPSPRGRRRKKGPDLE